MKVFSEQGFGIIQVLVVSAVMAIVGLGATAAIVNSLRLSQNITVRNEFEGLARSIQLSLQNEDICRLALLNGPNVASAAVVGFPGSTVPKPNPTPADVSQIVLPDVTTPTDLSKSKPILRVGGTYANGRLTVSSIRLSEQVIDPNPAPVRSTVTVVDPANPTGTPQPFSLTTAAIEILVKANLGGSTEVMLKPRMIPIKVIAEFSGPATPGRIVSCYADVASSATCAALGAKFVSGVCQYAKCPAIGQRYEDTCLPPGATNCPADAIWFQQVSNEGGNLTVKCGCRIVCNGISKDSLTDGSGAPFPWPQ